MSLPIPSPADPTLGEAMAALAAAESDDSPQTPAPAEPTPDSAPEPQTAPVEPQKVEGTPPEPKPGDTPGAPATPVPEQKTSQESKYAKNQARLNGSWKELNTEKETFRAERAKLQAEQEAFKRDQLAFEKRRLEANKAIVKPPEFYEQGATALDKAAEEAEKRGKYEEADKFRAKALLARETAADLRANPPKPDPTEEELTKQFGEEQKTWSAKAAQDFPDLVKKVKDKDGKEAWGPAMLKLQDWLDPKSVGYNKIIAEAVNNSPAGTYFAGWLAHADTVAARVPTLEKDLADSRAEVKKLNEKLSVSGGGLVNGNPQAPSWDSLTMEQQEEQLRAEAEQRGRLQ